VRVARFSVLAALAASTAFAAPSSDQVEPPSAKPRLKCEAGPLERYFGEVQWYVYACDDGASLVFYTGPKRPAGLEFYFIVFPKDGAYKLYGEGNGDKALTRPAYEALSAMTAAEFRALYVEVTAAGRADSSAR
jgi:hypothetical protein